MSKSGEAFSKQWLSQNDGLVTIDNGFVSQNNNELAKNIDLSYDYVCNYFF